MARIERFDRKSLVFTDNHEHARLCAIVNRVFTGSAIDALRPLAQRVADRLLRQARGDGAMHATLLMIDWLSDGPRRLFPTLS
ncbi:cytochrome P450 [Pseudonocardia nigra]|uniref:cytochrome P450 n=1 Tax=Pseudonocardia nigra TaxID=1921578 RepID=UPI001C5D4A86|nr:cytochrome P450 [Pseudonocardia nigra]